MKKLITLLGVAAMTLTGFGQTVHPDCQDGKIWFKVKDDAVLKKTMQFINQTHQLSETEVLRYEVGGLDGVFSKYSIDRLTKFVKFTRSPKVARIYELNFSDYTLVDQIIRDLGENPMIEYAERVPLMRKTVTPNDPSYGPGSQWALFQINAENAWNASLGNSDIVVAVVDDAVDIDHPDLAPALWVNTDEIAGNGVDDDGNGYVDDRFGADVANGTGDPRPGTPAGAFDHGTHVAGIATAATDNATGIASIGFGVSLMGIRSAEDDASLSSTYQGVSYAIENGADVINMSYGSAYYSTSYQTLINYGNSVGVTMIAAAGNDNVNSVFYPAGYDNVVSVAATNGSDAKASFSNYDDGSGWIDLAAPGTSIYSTVPTATGLSYDYKQGTSMASPLVAGLAGLMLSLNDALTPADIENCLVTTCDPATGPFASNLGAGRINAEEAMNCIAATLNWAPEAEFTANVTTVTEGASINFTDLSQYTPTSWSWNFGGGGTPNVSTDQDPTGIVFNTAGTYTVTLTATNANGSDTEIKTDYIVVNNTSGCDTATHTLPADTIYTRGFGPGNDYLGGTNASGFTAYCDFYQNIYPPGTYIQNIVAYFVEGETNTPGSTVTISIWDDAAGTPNSVVHTQEFSWQEIEDNQTVPGSPGAFYPTFIPLTTPFEITGDFYVGIEVTGAEPATEVAAIAYTHDFNFDATGRPGYSWMYASATNAFALPEGWYDLESTFVGAPKYGMHLYLETTTLPVTATMTATPTTVCEGEQVSFDGTPSVNDASYEWFVNGTDGGGTSTDAAPSFNYLTEGTYTAYLVAYNTCGYYDIDSMDITVDPSPDVSVVADEETICPGETVSLTASGATSYTWSPATTPATGANVVATPSSNTTYTVVGTLGSCTSASDVSIIVEQPPVAEFTYTPSTSLCYNQPIYFDGGILSTDATGYSWDFTTGTPGTSSIQAETVTFPSAGTYTVTLTVNNGCSETDNISYDVVIEDCDYLGIGENNAEWATLYYDPMNEIVNINLNQVVQNGQIVLSNALGQMVHSGTLKNVEGINQIDMNGQAKGVYLVTLLNDTEKVSFKFVK